MAFGEIIYTEDEVVKLVPLKNRSGLAPTDPTNVTLTWGEEGLEIVFTAPDTIIENQRLCTVEGALIMYKPEYPPNNDSDGTLIANLAVDEIAGLETDPFVYSEISREIDNYIWIIPYSDHSVYNYRRNNIYKVEPDV